MTDAKFVLTDAFSGSSFVGVKVGNVDPSALLCVATAATIIRMSKKRFLVMLKGWQKGIANTSVDADMTCRGWKSISCVSVESCRSAVLTIFAGGGQSSKLTVFDYRVRNVWEVER